MSKKGDEALEIIKEIMETEDHMDNTEEEVEAVTSTCKYVHTFLDSLSNTGVDKLTLDSRKQLLELKKRLESLNIRDEEVMTSKKEPSNADGLKENDLINWKLFENVVEKSENCKRTGNNKKTIEESEIKKEPKESRKSGNVKFKSKSSSDSEEHSKSEEFENSDTLDNSSTDGTERRRRIQRPSRSRNNKNHDILERMLERMDNRRTPLLEKYDENDGEEFESYLEKFENYCENNIRGDSSYWIKELGNHLSGDILKAYSAIKDKKDNYNSLKQKLVKWNRNMKDLRKRKARELFYNMKPKREEELYLYSNRLENQFKAAFPKISKKKIQTSKTLRERFLDTVPEQVKNVLDMQILSLRGKVESVTWEAIQTYARFRDLEYRKRTKKTEIESDDETEIIIIQQ